MRFYKEAHGINWNWSGGINNPSVDDNIGILNVLRVKGTGYYKMTPFFIPTWGMVGDNNGSNAPLMNYPIKGLL